MFELFNDTLKYGFNVKVEVKFKVKYEKSEKKANFIIIFCYCTKVYLNGKKCYIAK